MFFTVRGFDQESRRQVSVDLGYEEETCSYWYSVHVGEEDIAGELDISSLPDLINATRGYVTWDRRLYQNLRDAAVSAYVEKFPADDPVVKILASVR